MCAQFYSFGVLIIICQWIHINHSQVCFWFASLAMGQWYDCPSASKSTQIDSTDRVKCFCGSSFIISIFIISILGCCPRPIHMRLAAPGYIEHRPSMRPCLAGQRPTGHIIWRQSSHIFRPCPSPFPNARDRFFISFVLFFTRPCLFLSKKNPSHSYLHTCPSAVAQSTYFVWCFQFRQSAGWISAVSNNWWHERSSGLLFTNVSVVIK